MKLADVCPAATVTLAGTVRAVFELESGTTNPPAGAGEVKVTEHGVLPGVDIVRLVQLTEDRAAAVETEIVPEPPLAGIEEPTAVEATTPVMRIGMVLVDGFAAI